MLDTENVVLPLLSPPIRECNPNKGQKLGYGPRAAWDSNGPYSLIPNLVLSPQYNIRAAVPQTGVKEVSH